MKPFSSPKRQVTSGTSNVTIFSELFNQKNGGFLKSAVSTVVVLFILLFLSLKVMVYGDSISEIKLMVPEDSLSTMDDVSNSDSLPKNDSGSRDDSSTAAGTASQPEQSDAPAVKSSDAEGAEPSDSEKKSNEDDGLTNIVLTTKGIRASGWGEYRVGGRCLCCDNLLDGDCIIVHNTNRTKKKRLKQIVDGEIEADTSDTKSYFGDVTERDRPEFVRLLMAEIKLKKMVDVYKIVVYTMADKKKGKVYLSNCEFGYYDQFDRLQWAGKVENNKRNTQIALELKKPVLTKCILLKVKGGKNRITEVAIFCKNDKE